VGAAIESVNPDETLSLAAKASHKTISNEDWDKFQAYLKKDQAKKLKKPKVGNLCFLHGWSRLTTPLSAKLWPRTPNSQRLKKLSPKSLPATT